MNRPALIVATNSLPGAVALLQLHGPGSRDLVQQLTGRRHFEDHRLYLLPFADIDEGLAVCRGDDWAQLCPHGGPRVVRKLIDKLTELGATLDAQPNYRQLYPEAASDLEADMLAALALTPSPAAIDLLLAQPALWRSSIIHPPSSSIPGVRHLDALLTPPTVVVAGAANVGKSTLSNAILGRSASLVADLPGTTRDWVGSLAQISNGGWRRPGKADGGLGTVAVHWIDTPGQRDSDDPIEREAIALSQQVIERADVLILMREPASEYPLLSRQPDISVINKVDDARPLAASRSRPLAEGSAKPQAAEELSISALHERNLDLLQQRVLRVLGLDDISPRTLWAFSDTLKRYAAGEKINLRAYVSGAEC
ncbi:MAG: 50S ribosome-binding GTPase [Phycisphaeraceae bacterium]|nr:50S ribosome-binding GTPase [Phycisphaeraceae bacterium]